MGNQIDLSNTIKAVHIILTGYGHWLPNDPRGSYSHTLKKDELNDLGQIHTGRKTTQPHRSEIKQFYKQAEPALDHPTVWFDESMRNIIGESIQTVIETNGYTCWACAILRNHAHLIIRTHRDRSDVINEKLRTKTRSTLQDSKLFPQSHPVWSYGQCKIYLKDTRRIHTCIRYIENNPEKENLPGQLWKFVTPCHLK